MINELVDESIELRSLQVTQEFQSLESFAAHLVTAAVAMRETNKLALNEAAKVIKQDCRQQIGTYQEAVGDYPEWAPLAESTEYEKARLGAPADAPLERFGDLKRSFRSYLEDNQTVVVGSTEESMTYHEFGTSKMPPRPVLGPALLKNYPKIERLLGSSMLEALIVGQHLGYRFSARDGGIGNPGEEE